MAPCQIGFVLSTPFIWILRLGSGHPRLARPIGFVLCRGRLARACRGHLALDYQLCSAIGFVSSTQSPGRIFVILSINNVYAYLTPGKLALFCNFATSHKGTKPQGHQSTNPLSVQFWLLYSAFCILYILVVYYTISAANIQRKSPKMTKFAADCSDFAENAEKRTGRVRYFAPIPLNVNACCQTGYGQVDAKIVFFLTNMPDLPLEAVRQ